MQASSTMGWKNCELEIWKYPPVLPHFFWWTFPLFPLCSSRSSLPSRQHQKLPFSVNFFALSTFLPSQLFLFFFFLWHMYYFCLLPLGGGGIDNFSLGDAMQSTPSVSSTVLSGPNKQGRRGHSSSRVQSIRYGGGGVNLRLSGNWYLSSLLQGNRTNRICEKKGVSQAVLSRCEDELMQLGSILQMNWEQLESFKALLIAG